MSKIAFEFLKKDRWGLYLVIMLFSIQNIHSTSVEGHQSPKLNLTLKHMYQEEQTFFFLFLMELLKVELSKSVASLKFDFLVLELNTWKYFFCSNILF